MTSPTHLHHPHEAGASPSVSHPDEVASWLDEVRPVLAALLEHGRSPSTGRERWLCEQARSATEADDALDHLMTVSDSEDPGLDELLWLRTRVCAVQDALRRVGAEAAAAA